ncbi:transposable element Tcb2 transposase [Trichonephila clavipes]|nr:transposable element Tcb2 transposase [Trichonephila clavipes]
MNGDEYFYRDESRFSLSSDSHRILIWREWGSSSHPSNIIERDRYGGRGVLVWGGIMLGSRTDLHIFDAGSVNVTRYCNEILLPYVRLFRGAMGAKDRMFLAGHPSQGCFGLQSHCAPCYFFNQASFYPSDFSFSKCGLHYTCPYVLGILRY